MALSRRRAPMTTLLVLGAIFVFATTTFLASPASADLVNQTGQLTVFWGQHKDEGSLRSACDTGVYTMVIMSFLDAYGSGQYNLDISGHPVAGMGDEIKHCQSKGVLVSLAVGGFGGNYSLPTNQSALDLADHLWNTYLGGDMNLNGATGRPFGDARLDGVDLFVEHAAPDGGERYDVLATELAKRNTASSKPLHLTATAHCAYPDGLVKRALDTGVFERIHVRFYGDPVNCSIFLDRNWDKWTAAYPASRIFLGLLASEEQGDDWIFMKDLYYGVMPVVQQSPNYGGVMLWDRYYDNKSDYSFYVKSWA